MNTFAKSRRWPLRVFLKVSRNVEVGGWEELSCTHLQNYICKMASYQIGQKGNRMNAKYFTHIGSSWGLHVTANFLNQNSFPEQHPYRRFYCKMSKDRRTHHCYFSKPLIFLRKQGRGETFKTQTDFTPTLGGDSCLPPHSIQK